MSAVSRFRRHPDALPTVAVVLGYAVEVVVNGSAAGWLLALAPLVGLVVWLRRRAPLIAVAACLATWQLSDFVDPAFNEEGGLAWLVTWLVAHYALGRWTTGATAWAAPVVSVGTAVVLGRDDVFGGGFSSDDLAYFLSVSLLPWGVGLVVRTRSAHVAALQEENLRLEREQAEAARRAVAEERSRIARELHDVVSHAIAVTVLQSRGARRKLGHDEDAVRHALDAIEETNAAALSDMRRLLAVLRDTEEAADRVGRREPQPSLARLDRLVEEVRASGLAVELTVDGAPGSVPPGVDLSAYRIVQEALTNVLKHAGQQASAVVRLVFGSHDLTVCVRDTGCSDDRRPSEEAAGHGLLGIRERVAVVGGEVTAGPVAGGGYEVRARLPYALEAV
jgi:signal transduction histidine kinase